MKKKYISFEEALAKLQQFCAYQERCQSEVRTKLLECGIYGEELEQIIAQLIEDNYLNEERFAKCFTGGKFRIKQWGRKKIIQELKARQISAFCINKALESEIGETDYRETLAEVIRKKANLLTENDIFKKNYKIAQYAVSRGFESDIVWELIESVSEKNR